MLTAKGARWGDLEVLDEEDILKNIKKVVFEFEYVTIDLSFTEKPKVIKVKPVEKVPELAKCLLCKFKVHPNPPAHFTEEDKKHCCAFCKQTNGKRHGEHCKRCR
jgi:hypothetical protein